MNTTNFAAAAIVGVWMTLITGCGGSSSSGDDAAPPPPPPPQVSNHAIGGSVSGLQGTLVLANNGSNALTIDQDGSFTFATTLAAGSNYAVTVQTQPVNQVCSVDNGSGTVADAAITNIVINCVTPTRTVGGDVHGLNPSEQVVLQNNGGDALTLGADGTFTFANAVPAGNAYAVTVQTQPANQLCTVGHGSGTIGADNVTDVTVNCSTLTRTVGGTVSGLNPSVSVVLQNNGGDDLTINADGNFVFPVPVAQSGAYAVTVLTQPLGQTCSLTNGSGTAGGANISNVQVTCSINAYTVGGTVSGLSGTVVLQNNGADDLTRTTDGAFTFSTPVAEGATYNVTVLTQPAGQTCTVTNGGGTMGGGNVTNVGLSCSLNTTTLSISVSEIALSATGFTEYEISGMPSSGVARTISVTNTGSENAVNLAVSSPIWPAGTTSSSNCGSTLAAGASCTITISPGATATSDGTNPCSAGTAPVPGTIQVTGDNTNSVSSDAVILSYACIYQGGHVYAFDDTTPDTGSVGGKVVTTSDQASPLFGVVWSSNGGTGHGSGGTNATDVSYDILPGIDESSTPSTGSPAYSFFATNFSGFYTNPNPFTSASFNACNGASDGQCNTNNIVTFYNEFITNNILAAGTGPSYTASAGPTPLTYYAAGLCKQTIGGYSDWSLPAICEMGYGSSACGTAGAPAQQNMQSNLVDFTGQNMLFGIYWSSTQNSSSGFTAWYHEFLFGPSTQAVDFKLSEFGVRCSRALTL